MKTKEIYRFPNGVTELEGHLTWDVDALTAHVSGRLSSCECWLTHCNVPLVRFVRPT